MGSKRNGKAFSVSINNEDIIDATTQKLIGQLTYALYSMQKDEIDLTIYELSTANASFVKQRLDRKIDWKESLEKIITMDFPAVCPLAKNIISFHENNNVNIKIECNSRNVIPKFCDFQNKLFKQTIYEIFVKNNLEILQNEKCHFIVNIINSKLRIF